MTAKLVTNNNLNEEVGMLEEVQKDLRELARVRTLGDLRSAEVPGLRAIPSLSVYEHENDFLRGEALCAVIQDALDEIPEGEYHDAAFAIFGQTDGRWEPLSKRQEDAARAFHVGFDAFRRKRSDGRGSRFDEVLFELAVVLEAMPSGAVEAEHPNLAPRNAPSAAQSQPEGDSAPTADHVQGLGSPSTRYLGAIVVIAAVVLVALLAVIRPWDDSVASVAGSSEFGSATDCAYTEGQTESEPPRLTEAADLADELYHASGGFRQIGCPSGYVSDLGNGEVAFQQLDSAPGQPNGALVIPRDGSPILLNNAQWESYRQIGGKSGDDVFSTAGYPVATHQANGASWVDLDEEHGTLLVGESIDGPHFFMLKIAADRWMESGGVQGPLGLPTSNPHPRDGHFTQEFAGGYADLTTDGELFIHFVTEEEARAELPADSELVGHMLRQKEATAWWINDDLERLWIPSGEIYECLGGDNAWADGTVSIRGYAVHILQYGGVATCDDV